MEGATVLESNAHIPCSLQDLIHGLAGTFTPAGAVQKEHIGTLGTADPDAAEAGIHVAAGQLHVLLNDPVELAQPLGADFAVAADERVLAQNILTVVVGQGGFLIHTLPEPVVVDDPVGTHQTCQVEGLGGGIHGNGTHLGVLADGLGGNVLVTGEDQVGPDLVRDNKNVILLEQLHGALDLPALPDAAAGVVGGAENGGVDLVVHDLFLHVLEVHTPDLILIHIHGGVNDVVAVILQSVGEAHIGRGVDQHIIAPGTHHIQGADHTAQNAVGIADVLALQTFHAVAVALPVDDGVVILITGQEIAVAGVLGTLDDGFGDGGRGGEVHVRHPHGNQVKAVSGLAGGIVHSQSVHAMAVDDGGKIIFHGNSPFCLFNALIIRRKGRFVKPGHSCNGLDFGI